MIEATAANKVVVRMLTNIFRFQLQMKLSLVINLFNWTLRIALKLLYSQQIFKPILEMVRVKVNLSCFQLASYLVINRWRLLIVSSCMRPRIMSLSYLGKYQFNFMEHEFKNSLQLVHSHIIVLFQTLHPHPLV